METSKTVVEYSSVKNPGAGSERFPRIVIVIVLTEFCERFSYSGMRAFLTLYLRSKLGYSDDGATEVYHAFSMLVYLFPIAGGVLADNYLGKYKSILYLMVVYAAGNALVAAAAAPGLLPARLCTMLGLLMMAVGTGGIKPCVTAFGGDQFQLPQQRHHLAVYFSVLYFALCIGSLVAKTVSPILRAEVHCFGDNDCYSLAFGAPGLIVIVSFVMFVSARRRYVMKKPQGNVVFDFVKCIFLGLKNSIASGHKYDNNAHWLDSAQTSYDRAFLRDAKNTLDILTLFSVLPVFWSLLDQMGSRWSLQAARTAARLGPVSLRPDQVQVLGPVFVLIIIPIFHKIVYPYLEKHNVLRDPLHKLTAGGVLAGISFIVSGCLELYLQTTYPELPKAGYCQLRWYNAHPCAVTVRSERDNASYAVPPLSRVRTDVPVRAAAETPYTLSGECLPTTNLLLRLEQNAAHSYFLHENGTDFYKDNVDKSRSGFPVVRLLVSPVAAGTADVWLQDDARDVRALWLTGGVSALVPLPAGAYSVRASGAGRTSGVGGIGGAGGTGGVGGTSGAGGTGVGGRVLRRCHIDSGGVYAILVSAHNGTLNSEVLVTTAANSVSMAWLVPQFFIISVAEVLFAVTGNEFAFRQSPPSMAAVMAAAWLLTEAAGNLLIILVTRLCVHHSQATQFFIYSGMMFASMGVFHLLARRYRARAGARQSARPDTARPGTAETRPLTPC